MAPHSSTLAWKIPWAEELGGLQSMGSQRVRHDWATELRLNWCLLRLNFFQLLIGHLLLCVCMWLREGNAPHSSTLAWKILAWTEEPGRLQSMGLLRVEHDWATSLSLFTFMHWSRKWQPTPVFLPGESQGKGNMVGCRLWGRRVGHNWSDLAAAAVTFPILILPIQEHGIALHLFVSSLISFISVL